MPLKPILASIAALAWVLLAQPATGATVGLSVGSNFEDYMVYQAAVGELNVISIDEGPTGVYLITDLGATITPQTPSCTSISANVVRCEFPSYDAIVEVRAEDGADTVDVDTDPNFAEYPAFVYGGSGPDTLSASRAAVVDGGTGGDRLVGRRGRQYLSGGGGADSIDGGAGGDVLLGGSGADVTAGGPGWDIVSYGYRDPSVPIWISLDDRANDGAVGEGDSVQGDVEEVSGGRGPTTFVGNAGPNAFWGRDNRDVVRAGAGDDWVGGEGGRDLISGGRGDDALDGGNRADVIRGGRGNDRMWGGRRDDLLRGGPGHDRLNGEWGDDVLYARDGNRDIIRGGPGHDRAQVDPIDVLFSVEVLF